MIHRQTLRVLVLYKHVIGGSMHDGSVDSPETHDQRRQYWLNFFVLTKTALFVVMIIYHHAAPSIMSIM